MKGFGFPSDSSHSLLALQLFRSPSISFVFWCPTCVSIPLLLRCLPGLAQSFESLPFQYVNSLSITFSLSFPFPLCLIPFPSIPLPFPFFSIPFPFPSASLPLFLPFFYLCVSNPLLQPSFIVFLSSSPPSLLSLPSPKSSNQGTPNHKMEKIRNEISKEMDEDDKEMINMQKTLKK